MTRKLRANLLLLLTALIWGVAFVAQDVAMDHVQPFTFNGARMLLAAFALLPVVYFQERKQKAALPQTQEAAATSQGRSSLWLAGFLCGLMLFLGSSFQQMGIQQTSAGKAGFVTALYIVLVPLLGLFRGKRVRLLLWLAVLLCAVGLFLLCVTESLTIGLGDIYLLLCALCFAGHILVIDHFAPRVNCLRMSCLQFFICSVLSLAATALLEQPTWASLSQAIVPILYAGVLSGAVGYTLQIIAQRDTDPTVASLILCLESVFAVLASWLLQGSLLSLRELSGCGLMFVGILLAQLPERPAPR